LEKTQIHYWKMQRQSSSHIRTSLEDAPNLLHGNQASQEWSSHVEGYLWMIMWMWGIEFPNMILWEPQPACCSNKEQLICNNKGNTEFQQKFVKEKNTESSRIFYLLKWKFQN
jgi:hypothetical protein